MASIFLSYSRRDREAIRPLVDLLEQEGHDVWWDRHIAGGAQFSDAIADALGSVDIVIVVWSRASTNSSWVRDEASEGRDRGRLIPILLDDGPPPLGFRQIQSIAFSDWSGKGVPANFPDLLNAIAGLMGLPARQAAPAPRSPSRLKAPAMILGAILVASTVALLGAFLIFGTSNPAFSNEMTAPESGGNLDANGSWTLSWTSNGDVVHQGSMEIAGRTATIDMEVVRPQRRDRVVQDCAVSGYMRLTVACDRARVIGNDDELYDPDTFTFTFFDRNSLRGSVVDEVGTGSELVTATRR